MVERCGARQGHAADDLIAGSSSTGLNGSGRNRQRRSQGVSNGVLSLAASLVARCGNVP
jgi:hypothetical protein